MLVLAPKGYVTLAPEGYVWAASQMHLEEDLMSVAQSWMNVISRRTSRCSRVHTDLAQHICHLVAPDGLSSVSTYHLRHQMTPMNRHGVQECTGRILTSAWPSPVCIWQQQAPSGAILRNMKLDESLGLIGAPHMTYGILRRSRRCLYVVVDIFLTVFFVAIHRHARGDTIVVLWISIALCNWEKCSYIQHYRGYMKII